MAIDLTALIRAADRRSVDEVVLAGTVYPDVSLRRAAMRALGRMHDPGQAERLHRGLRDPDPEVRDEASLGLGALEASAPAQAERWLAGAIAAESDASVRARMIRDLGRLGRAFEETLQAEDPELRAAGCWALGEVALRGREIDPALRARAASLVSGEPVEVRLACTWALGRLPEQSPSPAGVEVALTLALGDVDPDVRAFAYRALGRHHPSTLEPLALGVADEDWRVAVAAFRALASAATSVEGGPALVGRALTRVAASPFEPPRVHVLLAALEAARPHARAQPVYDAAAAVHQRLGHAPPTRATGLAHCQSAALVDLGRGWPTRVAECGLGQTSDEERRELEAELLGEIEGADPQRLGLLRRAWERASGAREREAILRALGRVEDATAIGIAVEALASESPGVVASACETLTAHARREPAEGTAPPPFPTARTVSALRTALARLREGDELESLQACLGLIEAIEAHELARETRALARHPSLAVRARARAVLEALGETVPRDVDPVPAPVTELTPAGAPPRVSLETEAGTIVLELDPEHAPTTTSRFLELVDRGFYDGLRFHRVVSAFVAQTGDPGGDGYGGPGWWQRCEDNRLPYRRGTVGMALAGRDTGGSQFFIALGAQPHLETRYTAFGRVVEGLDVLDRILPGARIVRARHHQE